MSQEFTISLQRRTDSGKQSAKRLRASGQVPGAYYTAAGIFLSFAVDGKTLERALHHKGHVYTLSMDGESLHAILKEVQHHPVTDEVLHVDFFGIQLQDKIEIRIPVKLQGQPVGVTQEGGILSQVMMEVMVRCLATEVPDFISLDVSELKRGHSIHARELAMGGVELLTPADATIVSCVAPKEEVVEAPVAADAVAEGEVPAEGAPAEGDTKSEGEEKK